MVSDQDLTGIFGDYVKQGGGGGFVDAPFAILLDALRNSETGSVLGQLDIFFFRRE